MTECSQQDLITKKVLRSLPVVVVLFVVVVVVFVVVVVVVLFLSYFVALLLARKVIFRTVFHGINRKVVNNNLISPSSTAIHVWVWE